MSEAFLLHCRADSCGHSFMPKEQYRLTPAGLRGDRCKYQDLMIGKCSQCGRDEFAWLEVGYTDEVIAYHNISQKAHDSWRQRLKTHQEIDQKHTGAVSVRGSLNRFPFTFREMIPLTV